MSKEYEIQQNRMSVITSALSELGWEDRGETEHPIKYSGCHKFTKKLAGQADLGLFVAPAVEDYRCVTFWDREKCLAVVNTLTMMVVDSKSEDYNDTEQSLHDFLS